MRQSRPYQSKMEDDTFAAWNHGHRNVLAVAPTGAGKTFIMSSISARLNAPAVAVAHRQELVGQISLAMARAGIYHKIIAPKPVIAFCIRQHLDELGKSFYFANAPFAVAGIDTLIRRAETMVQWCNSVVQWTMDEAHHVLPNNKWGKGTAFFPNAKGLGFTATPLRADKKSLAREQGGLFDHMVLGPTMRELINANYLCDYRIFAPPASMDLTNVEISKATGDFNAPQLRKEAHDSTITGDIVQNYMNIAPGKRAIAFYVDVEQAVEGAQRFQNEGINAAAVSAKTSNDVRASLIKKFAAGDIDILCNVDLFGEGFDIPAVECVIMGRPTQSYGLYVQQFGRALRTSPGKTHGIIIDHVGNVHPRHNVPDAPREWSLIVDNHAKKRDKASDEIPITTCLKCFESRPALSKTCPFCGYVNEPADRSQPEFVEGDLVEFDPALLAQLRGEINKIDSNFVSVPNGADAAIAKSLNRKHGETQIAQHELRDVIAFWAGIEQQVYDRSDSEIHRRFFWKFGIDVMTAQTLKSAAAIKLTNMIRETYT